MPIERVWAIHLAATWFLTGLIWLIQQVHYPLMHDIGPAEFSAYSRNHQNRITPVVGIAMFLEVTSALALLSFDPSARKSVSFQVSLALLAIIWLSTALIQVPLHRRLVHGRDLAAITALVRTNWIRTVAWSARAAIVSLMVTR
jgi:magnesium-transporting ATPase (P-type)